MINISTYDLLTGISDIKNYAYPKYYNFVINQSDYDNGYVYRYFVQKINDADVIEVSSENYNIISKNLFIKVIVTWALIGPERNVYVNGKLYEQGVYEKNLQELNVAAKTMPDIKKIVTNYTQYCKPRKV